MASLHGKTALITGATGGIGEATAKRFLNEGANVMLVARSAEKLKATRDRLGVGKAVAQFVADAGDEAATVDTFGGVDVLLANAGSGGVLKATGDADREKGSKTSCAPTSWACGSP